MARPKPWRHLVNTARTEGTWIALGYSDPDGVETIIARVPETVFHTQLGSELPCTVIIRPGDHTGE